MPGAKKNFIGLEGFIWWVGVVEDRNDPEQLGRVRVRCFGWHTEDKIKIPTDALPWAHPVIPINSPNMYTPKEGDMVFGFFIDGDNAQNPAIMGVFPGKPEKKPNYQNGFSDPAKDLSGRPKKPDDASEAYPKSKYLKESTTNRLSRGKSEGTVIGTRTKNLKKSITSAGGVTWSEPSPAFKPTYPYNNALETESGHALEFDDTPSQERVHLAHRKGSFIEIDKDGNRVEKVVNDNYEIVMGSDYVYISGKCSVTVGGDCNLKVGGNLNAEITGGVNISADGAVKIKGASVNIEAVSGMDLKSGSSLNATGGSGVNIKGGGAVAISGSSVEIGSPLNVAGATNLTVSGVTGIASGSGPHAHGITKQPVSGSGAASAASASASGLKAAGTVPSDAQTSTTTTTSTVTTGSSLGKAVAGGTSTVSNVFTALSSQADGVLQNLSSNLPIGELTNKVQNFEYDVNFNRGLILGLKEDLQGPLLTKIDGVAKAAAAKNIDFNIDPDIQNKIDKVTYTTTQYTTQLGKHVYAKTESIRIPSANVV
jgi:hypothetical protein